MPVMSKKKQPDRHKTPRKGVQLPREWYAFGERLAGDNKMGITWYLIHLLNEAGKAAGKEEIPDVPWKPKEEE